MESTQLSYSTQGQRLILWIHPPKYRPTIYHYVARSGDSLSTIARKFESTVHDIQKANHLKNSTIYAGEKLTVPVLHTSENHYWPKAPEKGNQKTTLLYHVASGDSLYVIAKHYGIRIKDIQRWNHLGDRSMLHPGERLRIYL